MAPLRKELTRIRSVAPSEFIEKHADTLLAPKESKLDEIAATIKGSVAAKFRGDVSRLSAQLRAALVNTGAEGLRSPMRVKQLHQKLKQMSRQGKHVRR